MAAYRGVFRTRSKIDNGDFFAKIVNGLKLLTIFAKKAPLKMFSWVEKRLLANRTSVYVEAAIRRVLLKSIMRNFAKFTRKRLCRNIILIKLDSVDLQLY